MRQSLREFPRFLVSPNKELMRQRLERLLEAQLRICFAEIHEIKTRSEVKSAIELEKIEKGDIAEHTAWEDLIVLENLEERAKKIRKELLALKQE